MTGLKQNDAIQKLQIKIEELEKATVELNKVKDALRESEERYRAVFEMTGTAMVVVENDTTISMANHKLKEITGYSNEEITKKRKWTEVVVAQDSSKMLEYHRMRRINNSSVPYAYEFQLIDKNDNIRDMIANVAVLPFGDRSIVSLIDISDLKRTERALRISENKYREIVEGANDFIFTIDLDGKFTSANRAAFQTYGFNHEDLINTSISQIVDPSNLDIAKKMLLDKKQLLSENHRYKLLTRTKNGEAVWVELSTSLVRENGKIIGVQGIARNITEWKKNDEELQDSRQRFKEVADILPGIIVEIDMQFNLTYANAKGLQSFGYTHEDYKKGINVQDIVPAHLKDRFMNDIYNIFHGDYGNPETYCFYRKDKSIIHVIINSAPIIKNYNPIGVRTCMIDISDRVRAEEMLKISEEKFRTIFDQSPIGVALFTEEGAIADYNKSFRDMFGSLLDENRKGDFELFSEMYMNKTVKDELFTNNAVVFESEHKRSENSSVYFEWHITRLGIQNEQLPFLAQVQDITERKIAQEAKLKKERDATVRARKLVAGLRRELREKSSFNSMVSRSPEMKKIFQIVPEVASTTATVLIYGDSGTGKELIARSLHELSPRKSKPFIAINCSALPDTLLESELFGYKAGAFTDAKKNKPGKFALAEGGSIFLDEIGDISVAMQVKLLRILQERVYEPLGGTTSVRTNVRVIAATNKNLEKMVKNGEFREDLYYRINIVTVKLPPLCERICDIPILCDHFIDKFNARYDKNIKEITQEAIDTLLSYSFPGNIRELENIIEHCFIFCKDKVIDVEHLPLAVRGQKDQESAKAISSIKNFDDLEKVYLKKIIDECGGSKARAAEKIGIHKATLFRKLKQLGMVDNP